MAQPSALHADPRSICRGLKGLGVNTAGAMSSIKHICAVGASSCWALLHLDICFQVGATNGDRHGLALGEDLQGDEDGSYEQGEQEFEFPGEELEPYDLDGEEGVAASELGTPSRLPPPFWQFLSPIAVGGVVKLA
jgi:hypothetical protein